MVGSGLLVYLVVLQFTGLYVGLGFLVCRIVSDLENQFENVAEFSAFLLNLKIVTFLRSEKDFICVHFKACLKDVYLSCKIMWSAVLKTRSSIILSFFVMIGPQ